MQHDPGNQVQVQSLNALHFQRLHEGLLSFSGG